MDVKRFLSKGRVRKLDAKVAYAASRNNEAALPSELDAMLAQIYHAKCRTLNVRPAPMAERQFRTQFFAGVRKRSICLPGLGFGVGCTIVLELVTACPDIVVLDLSRNDLGDAGAHVLGQMIPSLGLISLVLRSNRLSAAGVTHICNALIALGSDATLYELDLSAQGGTGHNQLGTEGCRVLAQTLAEVPTIGVLRIAGCGVTLEGCQFLAQSMAVCHGLVELDVSGNELGAAGACALVGGVLPPSLESLCLARNAIGDGAVGALCNVVGKSCVRRLDLSYNELSPRLLGAFCDPNLVNLLDGSVRLQTLELAHNDIGECGEALASLFERGSSIRSLSLSYNPVGSATISKAAEGLCARLEELYLCQTKLDDEGVAALAGLLGSGAMRVLDLSHNRISAARPIADALASSERLQVLDISDNDISDPAPFIEALGRNSTLQRLEFGRCAFDFEGRRQLRFAVARHERRMAKSVEVAAQAYIGQLEERERELMRLREECTANRPLLQKRLDSHASLKSQIAEAKQATKDSLVVASAELEAADAALEAAMEGHAAQQDRMGALRNELEKRQRDCAHMMAELDRQKRLAVAVVGRLTRESREAHDEAAARNSDARARVADLRAQLRTVVLEAVDRQRVLNQPQPVFPVEPQEPPSGRGAGKKKRKQRRKTVPVEPPPDAGADAAPRKEGADAPPAEEQRDAA